jgi:hypothetical protein
MAKNILVEESDSLIPLSIYYQVKKNKFGVKQYKILTDEEGIKAMEKGDPNTDVLNTKWAASIWKITTSIMRASTFYNPADGAQVFDPVKYQDNVFKICLKDWDIEDGQGSKVPITVESIGKLPKAIADELLRKYNFITSVDEIEEKK